MLATVSDKKLQGLGDHDAFDHYEADVLTATDYFPFGRQMPGRTYAAGSGYRYGFNSQEQSTEVDPNGNNMTAEFWQYDARIGRRWNVEPKSNSSISVYAALQNNPIFYFDLLGDTTVPQGEWYRHVSGKNITYKYAVGKESDYLARDPQSWWRIPESSRNRKVYNKDNSAADIDLHADGTFLVLTTDIREDAVRGHIKWKMSLVTGGTLYVEARDYMQSKGVGDGAFWEAGMWLFGGKVAKATGRLFTPFATAAAKGSTSLVNTGAQWSKHSLQRLAERGVTQDMAELAISKGQKFYDPLNKSINYVLPNSFASGKSLLVGTNPLTGQVTTALRSSKNLINSRFIPIK